MATYFHIAVCALFFCIVVVIPPFSFHLIATSPVTRFFVSLADFRTAALELPILYSHEARCLDLIDPETGKAIGGDLAFSASPHAPIRRRTSDASPRARTASTTARSPPPPLKVARNPSRDDSRSLLSAIWHEAFSSTSTASLAPLRPAVAAAAAGEVSAARFATVAGGVLSDPR